MATEMKEARAAAERNAEPNGVQRKSHCPEKERWREEQRSQGDRRNVWLRSMARGAREEVAWNGYNNTEESPALFFGRQPGRAAPDGRN